MGQSLKLNMVWIYAIVGSTHAIASSTHATDGSTHSIVGSAHAIVGSTHAMLDSTHTLPFINYRSSYSAFFHQLRRDPAAALCNHCQIPVHYGHVTLLE